MDSEVYERLKRINEHVKINSESELKLPIMTEIRPGIGLYIGMLLLSVFISLVGLIVSVIYLSQKNRYYQSLGATMLILSVLSMICAVLVMLITI